MNVPHDWAIEGPNPPANPFSSTAATTGRGGYVPSGIAWYRKHFTLSQYRHQVFIEFDGVMGNSTVYVNGASIGNHPYGYVSFRYDITSNVKFTGDNVIAVKTDTSVQPASRFYAGAGIYRHARLIATDPVHVDQWATFVTTPAPTTTSATVKVQTTVVNTGTASASVSVQGIVSDPSGVALAPVTTAAQSIAAAASASFTFDVPVTNPKLWDTKTPNMYQLVTNLQVGGSHGGRRRHAIWHPGDQVQCGNDPQWQSIEVPRRVPATRTITALGWRLRSEPCSDGWRSSSFSE